MGAGALFLCLDLSSQSVPRMGLPTGAPLGVPWVGLPGGGGDGETERELPPGGNGALWPGHVTLLTVRVAHRANPQTNTLVRPQFRVWECLSPRADVFFEPSHSRAPGPLATPPGPGPTIRVSRGAALGLGPSPLALRISLLIAIVFCHPSPGHMVLSSLSCPPRVLTASAVLSERVVPLGQSSVLVSLSSRRVEQPRLPPKPSPQGTVAGFGLQRILPLPKSATQMPHGNCCS